MAGKVKKKGDDAPQSKTARASLRTGAGKAEFIAAADAPRIVPLGGGTHAYILDPRDGNVDDRLQALDDDNGVWRCHTQFNCVAACPKGINLTDSIMKMKRSLLFPKKFRDKSK